MRVCLLTCVVLVACSETASSETAPSETVSVEGTAQASVPSGENQESPESEAGDEREPSAVPYITTLSPRVELIYETPSTRRCPVRDVAFFPETDQVVVAGQEGVSFIADGERTDFSLPEPLYGLARDGAGLVGFGRYGMIVRLRGEGEERVHIEGEHLSPPRSFFYSLARDGDVLRAISPGVVLRYSEGEWSAEARGAAEVASVVGQPLLDEMRDARHHARVYDSASDAMAEFSEDGDAITFRGFGAERTLTLPETLSGAPSSKGGGFSGGSFAAWRGRNVGRFVDEGWQLFEMPGEVESVVSTPGKALLVHGCQHVWLVRH